MLNDTETTQDLLNYQVVADTAAQMIKESLDEPISIGISGNWGAGKSSLVKMIGCSLEDANITKDNENLKRKYVIVNFNAWLYQGYDDARSALLQIVADALEAETKKNTSTFDKCKVFFKRVNWFKALIYVTKATKIAGNIISGNVSEAINTGTETIEEASKDIFVKGSIPEHIDSLRQDFQEALKELNIHLVVLVDDLDRCLPDIAISTLEAIRLLLFIEETFKELKEVEGIGKPQVRNLESTEATFQLQLFAYVLVELWSWNQNDSILKEFRGLADDPNRRPSHADKRKLFRFQLLEKELLRISPDRLNPEKIKTLLKCLISMGI